MMLMRWFCTFLVALVPDLLGCNITLGGGRNVKQAKIGGGGLNTQKRCRVIFVHPERQNCNMNTIEQVPSVNLMMGV